MLCSITENSAFAKMDSRRDTKRGGKPKTKPPLHISVGPRFCALQSPALTLTFCGAAPPRHESRRAVQRLTTALMPALTYAAIARSALLFAGRALLLAAASLRSSRGGGGHTAAAASAAAAGSPFIHTPGLRGKYGISDNSLIASCKIYCFCT